MKKDIRGYTLALLIDIMNMVSSAAIGYGTSNMTNSSLDIA